MFTPSKVIRILPARYGLITSEVLSLFHFGTQNATVVKHFSDATMVYFSVSDRDRNYCYFNFLQIFTASQQILLVFELSQSIYVELYWRLLREGFTADNIFCNTQVNYQTTR